MPSRFFRASFTLPPEQALALSDVAKRLGASQSLVLSVLLEETLPWLELGLNLLPDGDAGAVVARRSNGPQGDVVRGVIQTAIEEGKSADQLALSFTS